MEYKKNNVPNDDEVFMEYFKKSEEEFDLYWKENVYSFDLLEKYKEYMTDFEKSNCLSCICRYWKCIKHAIERKNNVRDYN